MSHESSKDDEAREPRHLLQRLLWRPWVMPLPWLLLACAGGVWALGPNASAAPMATVGVTLLGLGLGVGLVGLVQRGRGRATRLERFFPLLILAALALERAPFFRHHGAHMYGLAMIFWSTVFVWMAHVLAELWKRRQQDGLTAVPVRRRVGRGLLAVSALVGSAIALMFVTVGAAWLIARHVGPVDTELDLEETGRIVNVAKYVVWGLLPVVLAWAYLRTWRRNRIYRALEQAHLTPGASPHFRVVYAASPQTLSRRVKRPWDGLGLLLQEQGHWAFRGQDGDAASIHVPLTDPDAVLQPVAGSVWMQRGLLWLAYGTPESRCFFAADPGTFIFGARRKAQRLHAALTAADGSHRAP